MVMMVYVRGTVRKDAVEIIPKDVRLTEARVLEIMYGEGWVPRAVHEVEVDELPTAAEELDRLMRIYDPDKVTEAFGTAVQARKDITDLFKMDTAKAVKDSGVIAEVAGPIEVEKAPEVGTKAHALAAVDKADKADLKPTVETDEEEEEEDPEEEEEDPENLTKDEIKAKLDDLGVSYPSSATKAELIALLNSAE